MTCYRCDRQKKYNITLSRESFNRYHTAFRHIKNPYKDHEVIELVKMKLETFIAEAIGKCTCFIRSRINNI